MDRGTHLLLRRVEVLGTPETSYAMWSAEPATTVVFFVHGFLGSAMSTWRQMDTLAPRNVAFEFTDFVFLGYDSFGTQTNMSASALLQGCERLIHDPPAIINPTLAMSSLYRNRNHRYSEIVFVAHSLGAIVTRQLLLAAHSRKAPWVNDARFFLFAPAHKGSTEIRNLPLGAAKLAGPLDAVIATFISWKVQTLSEVKENSTTLTGLEARTKAALQQCVSTHSSRKHVVAEAVLFGEREDVVQTEPFCEDPASETVTGKGHRNICKPTRAFDRPVKFLAGRWS